MYFVYILESINTKSYYVGCTNDLDRRLREHNSGINKSTRKKRPWILKYQEDYASLSEARQRENQIKSWKKRSMIEKLMKVPIA